MLFFNTHLARFKDRMSQIYKYCAIYLPKFFKAINLYKTHILFLDIIWFSISVARIYQCITCLRARNSLSNFSWNILTHLLFILAIEHWLKRLVFQSKQPLNYCIQILSATESIFMLWWLIFDHLSLSNICRLHCNIIWSYVN